MKGVSLVRSQTGKHEEAAALPDWALVPLPATTNGSLHRGAHVVLLRWTDCTALLGQEKLDLLVALTDV